MTAADVFLGFLALLFPPLPGTSHPFFSRWSLHVPVVLTWA